jgi:hypothetical protein
MIRRVVRGEGGMTVIEVTMAAALLVVVLGAAIAPFDLLHRTERRTVNQNESQDNARNAVAVITRNLRNTSGQNRLVNLASSYDMVIETVDQTSKPAGSQNARNAQRVRYCLDSSDPNNERIWSQSQTWTTATIPAVPSTMSCPDPAWGNQKDLADHIVNRIGGQNRPVWIPDSANVARISEMQMQLFVDFNPGRQPAEQELDSSVYFRNENQPPVSTFTYLVNANGSVVLNATGSYDPEGSPITYQWFDGSTPIGQGLAFQWNDATSGNHTITLTVTDSSGSADSTSATVTVP